MYSFKGKGKSGKRKEIVEAESGKQKVESLKQKAESAKQ
jgi:hypothetical protein